MALITKVDPVRVDVVINRLQELIYNNISWGGVNKATEYEAYGRAYKNETNNTLIWEAYDSDDEYKEILMDDNFLASSFWFVSDTEELVEYNKWKATVSGIFQLNLDELYTSIAHRADEEAHNEVISILQDNTHDYDITTLVKGIRNVYTELGYGANKFEDMQPYHVFRVNLEVTYNEGC